MDDSGNKLWEKSYGGVNEDQLGSAAKVPSGGYVLAGLTESPPSGNKTSPVYGGTDFWVVRIDDNGNLLWENTYGSDQYDGASKVIPTKDGGFLVGGISISNNPGFNNGYEDYEVIKIDANGNLLWTKLYGGSGYDELHDMIETSDGNYFLSGTTNSPVSGNKTAPSLGGYDMWLVCIAPDGSKLWDKTYGTSGDDFRGTLSPLIDGNYLLTGYTFDGTGDAGVIRKIDKNGNEIWQRSCAGNNQDVFEVAAQDSNGDIYAAGESKSDGYGCKTSPNVGGNDDIWIAVFDSSGNKIDDLDYGGEDVDLVTDVEILNNEVWIVGWSDSHLNGNKTVNNCGQTADGWIIRLSKKFYITPPTPVAICLNGGGSTTYFTAFNNYQPGNVFTVQLSDVNGSFSSFTNIGSKPSLQSDSILVTLPVNLIASDHYKIRVVASSPADTSTLYGVSIHGVPRVDLGNDTLICANKPLVLSAGTQATGTGIVWSTGSTQTGISVTAPATYWCEATNSCGVGRDSIRVSVLPLPVAYIGNDTSFCIGSDVILQSSPQPNGTAYLWNTGAATTSIIVHNGGLYWLQTSNACGSTADSATVVENQLPAPGLDKRNYLCAGASRTLSATPGFGSYLWNDGNTGASITISNIGQYWVAVKDKNGCINADTVNITGILALPANFLPADTSVCFYIPLVLQPSLNFKNYEWSTGQVSKEIAVPGPSLYWLQVTDENGCVGTDSIRIGSQECPTGIYMPNAFTPNNDGLNDVFRVKSPIPVKQFNMIVYDRFGEKIFETNDISQGWNGTWKGVANVQGSYVWVIRYTDTNNKTQQLKGTVTLLR